MPVKYKQNKIKQSQYVGLAPYASCPEQTKGRLYKEPESNRRSVYQRDRDRIIHSSAFRRLEYKTQVFVNNEGDHYRTRLTHSLEVAQLSRSIARELHLNEDLSEALALAHDLGHPPFGHAGEDALHDCMEKFGGFDHNAQSIRILTKLEQKYAEFDGLNLTWETLEGITKHNGPLISKGNKKLPRAIEEYQKKQDLGLKTYAGLEAQTTALCDDIAYVAHDVEDGIRAGLFKITDIIDIPFVGDTFIEVMKKYPDISDQRLIHETKRRMINTMCADLVHTTRELLKNSKVKSADDIRNYGKPLAAFSDLMQENIITIKEYLMEAMYRHYKVNRMTSKGKRILRELFEFFHAEPECLPTSWRKLSEGQTPTKKAIVVADFIAGMTDRFAVEEHKRIFDLSYKIIGDYGN